MSATTAAAGAPESSKAKPVRERLLDAAEGCLQQFGPQKTSMEDVARAAGMSRATVYRYFEDTDDLFLTAGTIAAGGLLARMVEAVGGIVQANVDEQLDYLVLGNRRGQGAAPGQRP